MGISNVRRRKKQRGMTLVEVTIGLALLVFGMLGTLAALTSCITLSTVSDERSRAVHAVREKLEEVRSSSVVDMVDLYHNTKFRVPPLDRAPSDSAGLVLVDAAIAERPTITVRVTWTSVIGNNETYQLSTIVTDF